MSDVRKGKLYVVATPIGNLRDITLRALDILKQADAVACEDTRHSKKLLRHHELHPKELLSLHQFNEKARAGKILALLEKGVDVALISDAGTPAICDPGRVLIEELIRVGIVVHPIPGPSALIAAMSAAGLDAERFVFDGFLPRKSSDRRRRLAQLQREERTLAFYEVPHRIVESLQDILAVLGDRKAVLAREMTKLHEEIARGTVQSLLAKASAWEKCRGEMVLMLEGCQQDLEQAVISQDAMQEALRACLIQGLSQRDAIRKVAQQYRASRKEVYRLAVGPSPRSSP